VATTNDATVLIGVFYGCEQAEKAFRELKQVGFGDHQIRVSLLDAEWTATFPPLARGEPRTNSGAAVGLLGGSTAGGLLAALAMGTGWLGGIGPVLLIAFYLTILVGAASAGGLLGAWIGSVLSRPEPRGIPRTLHESRGVVTVRPDSRYDEAAAILRRCAGCKLDPTSAGDVLH
jgi:hypothetical protein